MKNLLTICALVLLLQPLHLSFAQSTNGNGNSQGRENWFPNRGNVGIGTRSPSEALEVLGNVRVSQTVFTNDLVTIGLKATTLHVLQDATIGRNLLVNGNVGINVPSPTERLEIGGNLKVTQGIFSNSVTSGDGLFTRDLRSNQNIIVDGSIGIGIATPTEKLEVIGNAKITQGLYSTTVNATDGFFSGNIKGNQNVIVDGLVGIGISSPGEKLEVAGNIKASQGLLSDYMSTGEGTFSRNLHVSQNFFVAGNTGLGVSSPSEKLEVSGNIKSSADVLAVNVRADKGYFSSLESNGNLTINGNVGIGTATPSEKLEVAGNIKATQSLLANSAQITQDISAGGNLSVAGNVGIGVAPGTDKFTVGGSAYFNGLLTAENLTVKQKLDIKGTFSLAGTLGIGVATPEASLHVNGDGKFDGDIRANKIIVNAIEIAGATQTTGGGSNVSLGENLFVNGTVGIGTTKVTGYKLSVDGKIRAGDDIKVYSTTEWSDYVFEKNYKLRSLEDVEQYIKKHGHLDGIPSAAEVKKEGIDLAAMDAKLLQKIEELTLYMIEMKKENELLMKQDELLKKEIKALKASKKN